MKVSMLTNGTMDPRKLTACTLSGKFSEEVLFKHYKELASSKFKNNPILNLTFMENEDTEIRSSSGSNPFIVACLNEIIVQYGLRSFDPEDLFAHPALGYKVPGYVDIGFIINGFGEGKDSYIAKTLVEKMRSINPKLDFPMGIGISNLRLENDNNSPYQLSFYLKRDAKPMQLSKQAVDENSKSKGLIRLTMTRGEFRESDYEDISKSEINGNIYMINPFLLDQNIHLLEEEVAGRAAEVDPYDFAISLPNGKFAEEIFNEFQEINKTKFNSKFLDILSLKRNPVNNFIEYIAGGNYFASVLMNEILERRDLCLLSHEHLERIPGAKEKMHHQSLDMYLYLATEDEPNKYLAIDIHNQLKAMKKEDIKMLNKDFGDTFRIPLIIPLRRLTLRKDESSPYGLAFDLKKPTSVRNFPDLGVRDYGDSGLVGLITYSGETSCKNPYQDLAASDDRVSRIGVANPTLIKKSYNLDIEN